MTPTPRRTRTLATVGVLLACTMGAARLVSPAGESLLTPVGLVVFAVLTGALMAALVTGALVVDLAHAYGRVGRVRVWAALFREWSEWRAGIVCDLERWADDANAVALSILAALNVKPLPRMTFPVVVPSTATLRLSGSVVPCAP